MTQPVTGTEWGAGGFADIDSRLAIRGPLVAACVRDYRGADTDLSPFTDGGAVNWSPFAQDGKLRADLFAVRKVNGVWVENTDTNEGWYYTGANTPDGGPEREPNIDTSDLDILQSRYPIDTDITREGKTVTFTPIESLKPLIKRLKNNLPLTDAGGTSLVENPGASDYFVGKPVEADFVERQLLLIRARSKAGRKIFTVEAYPLVKLTNVGAAQMHAEDADAAELGWTVLPDPYFMIPSDSGDLIPGLEGEWVAGEGWTGMASALTNTFTVSLGSPSAGTFTLTYRGRTTDPIAYNATAANVKTALVALDDGFTSSDWTVTGSAGGPYSITTPRGSISGDGSGLTGGTFVVTPA